MKYAPYSFSKLSLHGQCPRKFKYRYIDKLPTEPIDKTALYKGTCIHDMLENYPNASTNKLVPKYQHIFDKFMQSKYAVLIKLPRVVEEGIGLTENLEPVKYSKNTMFRGYIDCYTVVDDTMLIIDWKTGKYRDLRYQSFDQLMYYAIYMFQKYSKLNKIKLMYIYVEHDLDNSITLERRYLNNYISDFTLKIQNTELDTSFNKVPQKLCEYCEYEVFCSKN